MYVIMYFKIKITKKNKNITIAAKMSTISGRGKRIGCKLRNYV